MIGSFASSFDYLFARARESRASRASLAPHSRTKRETFSDSLRFRLLRASALVLRPKIAGFIRKRMETGIWRRTRTSMSHALSSIVFARIHVREEYFSRRIPFRRILLGAGEGTGRDFRNHRKCCEILTKVLNGRTKASRTSREPRLSERAVVLAADARRKNICQLKSHVN